MADKLAYSSRTTSEHLTQKIIRDRQRAPIGHSIGQAGSVTAHVGGKQHQTETATVDNRMTEAGAILPRAVGAPN